MEQKIKFTCDGEQLHKALLKVTKEFKGRKWVYFKTCFAEQKLYLDNIVSITCYDFSGDDVAFDLWRGEIKRYVNIDRNQKLRFEVEGFELQINTTLIPLSKKAQTFTVEPIAKNDRPTRKSKPKEKLLPQSVLASFESNDYIPVCKPKPSPCEEQKIKALKALLERLDKIGCIVDGKILGEEECCDSLKETISTKALSIEDLSLKGEALDKVIDSFVKNQ